MLKKVLFGLVLVGVGSGVWLSVVAARFEPVLPPNVFVGSVGVGGVSREEAARKLRLWWDTERRRQLGFNVHEGAKAPAARTLTAAGVRLDDVESIRQIPSDEFWDAAKRAVGLQDPERREFSAVFIVDDASVDSIKTEVERDNASVRPAKVFFDKGALRYQAEQVGSTLDDKVASQAIEEAARTGLAEVDLPLVEAPKRVSDEALRSIREVVSTFSTRFSAGQVSRSSNIRTAATRIDGLVLLPGEKFSFNGAVGKRTLANGFKLAGVYINGRHDTGIGGGICQVSTTLYNAALFANLKIVRRQNHSLPVPYVPLGRDATVDFGNIDFSFENSFDHPIAISSAYTPGRLTFRILGQKDPNLEVKVESGAIKSWSRGEKVVHDGTLPYGKSRVVEKGASGHRVTTYRVVRRDGKVVAREPLGTSTYAGAQRIVARNLKAAPAPPPRPPVQE